jgi:hypothetical protein
VLPTISTARVARRVDQPCGYEQLGRRSMNDLLPSGLSIAVVTLPLELFLAGSYRGAFAPMLGARVRPGGR